MPTYNCSEYIPSAINSILNQTYKDFEFLIIDDGSTDNTYEIISKFDDKRIKYIKKEHTGFSDSLNYGLKIAANDCIVRMDADDIAHPDLIQSQYSLFSKRDKSYWIGCNYAVFDDKRKKISYIIKNPQNHETIKKGLALHGYLNHPGSIMSRDFVLKLGGYNRLEAFEDYELWLRGINNFTFENNKEILLYYRYRKDSLSRKNIEEKYKLNYQIQQPYYNNLYKYFDIKDKTEEIAYRGWREFFYGDKKKAREFWSKNFIFIQNTRIFIAFIFTFFPNKYIVYWKELRIKFKFIYCSTYLRDDNKKNRVSFNKNIN